MNKNDIILRVLTPGSTFNPKSRIFRSIKTLVAFTGLDQDDVLGILDGDLANDVEVKPGKKGLMVALKGNIPVKVKVGHAHLPPDVKVPKNISTPLPVEGAGGFFDNEPQIAAAPGMPIIQVSRAKAGDSHGHSVDKVAAKYPDYNAPVQTKPAKYIGYATETGRTSSDKPNVVPPTRAEVREMLKDLNDGEPTISAFEKATGTKPVIVVEDDED